MMKRSSRAVRSALVIALSFLLVLQGCALPAKHDEPVAHDEVQFTELDDPNYHSYLQDSVYNQVVESLDSEDYLVGNVEVKYISKEYLNELSFNSKENIIFGYSLSALDELYEGEKYVFTVEDGKTRTQAFNSIKDTRFDETIENVAVGGGIILICVTVSAVAAPAAPAVSAIFAAGAKGAAALGAIDGAVGTVAAGVAKQVETGNFEEALKEAAFVGSEAFKMGAVAGAVSGGASKASSLKSMTGNGLTLNEAAKVQKESKWPAEVISKLKSVDEYDLYKNAGLRSTKINGKTILSRDIDYQAKFKKADGSFETNLERMLDGRAPLDPTGKPYELHHVNQENDGVLAILTEKEHRSKGNYGTLHESGRSSEIIRDDFNGVRKQFWKDFAQQYI